MVVAGPEELVFMVAQGACSCGAPADCRLDVRRYRPPRYLPSGLVYMHEAVVTAPQCYVCRTCGAWAFQEAHKARLAGRVAALP